MINESAMEKWFKFEIARLNSGLVTKKRPLNELVKEEIPKAEAKDGSIYYFNKEALSRLEKDLLRESKSIRLPISFYTSLEVKGNAYVADRQSFVALKHLGEIPEKAELVEGKYWMGKTLVTDMMKRRPTIFQIVRI
jgi:uncharacterized protein (UPF0216 family)